MSPRQRYLACLEQPDFDRDAAQEEAIAALDAIWADLETESNPSFLTKIGRKLGLVTTSHPPRQGLYMWGGVGRGKTFLMDLFFNALTIPGKRRQHFHRFMLDIHRRLKTLGHMEDPLERVASDIAAESRVICFDEFFVADITDAMILGRLFEKLFCRGITLIATSNIPPDQLYSDGLQRQRFLPAIAALKKHCEILNVDGGVDYRLRVLELAEIYHYPLDDDAETSLATSFERIAGASTRLESSTIKVEGRKIPIKAAADGVAWFEFSELCDGPRSVSDYIEIAQEFHTVLISNIPEMDWKMENQARRFINLVDEFYDHGVNLIVSAQKPVETLYSGERLAFEYQRTRSRLLEMQSTEYLSSAHK
ncbi:MAG: cell division protein ZapE [Gammaproteobacteria bacterium]|nr:cell division protein ZapE [Gammaproteobacteria bacterium]